MLKQFNKMILNVDYSYLIWKTFIVSHLVVLALQEVREFVCLFRKIWFIRFTIHSWIISIEFIEKFMNWVLLNEMFIILLIDFGWISSFCLLFFFLFCTVVICGFDELLEITGKVMNGECTALVYAASKIQ